MTGKNSQQKSLSGQMLPMKLVTLHLVTASRTSGQIGPDTLLLVDAGITGGGFFEHVRDRCGHVLGALEAGAWENLSKQRRLADGSVLAWVNPSRRVKYPMKKGMWVRLISYHLTDERLGEVGTVYRL